MKPGDEFRRLGVYLNDNDRAAGRPLYAAIVQKARTLGLAGASVFKGEIGYGTHRVVHDTQSEYSFVGSPVVVEVVDRAGPIDLLMRELGNMMSQGCVTVSSGRVITREHPAVESKESTRTGSMPIEGEGQRVSVYLGSSDTWHGTNLAVAIVERCRALGFAGATASRGIMGFGRHSIIHRAHILGLSADLPEKIEIIDRPDRIAALLPVLEEMVSGGLIVVEDVHVVRYQDHSRPAS